MAQAIRASKLQSVNLRWREPEERTIFELFNPDQNSKDDRARAREFEIEIHRRILLPLLAPLYAMIAVFCLLRAPANRHAGQGRYIIGAIIGTVLIQSIFLAAFSMAKNTDMGLFLMYGVVVFGFVTLFVFSRENRGYGHDKGALA